jgi:hypothetical protein
MRTEDQESAAAGYPEWEVRVQCGSHRDATELAEKLVHEGVPNLRRWKYLLVGALDEDSADELADRIRQEAPAGSTTTVEGTAQTILEAATTAAGRNPYRNPFAVLQGSAGWPL